MKKLLIITVAAVLTVMPACSTRVKPHFRAVKPEEVGIQTICPVTNNVFTVAKETKAFDYKDKTYYLCCDDCKDEFLKKLDVFALQEKQAAAGKTGKAGEILYWTCAMHPQIRRDKTRPMPDLRHGPDPG